MSDKAKMEQHVVFLGKLIGNLQSLEMGARMAIVKHDEWAAKKVQAQLPDAKRGDRVEVNAFTNSDDLQQTLDKFNKRAPSECRIDAKPIVALRDALAHGRTFGTGPVQHLRLLKFSRKAVNGKVEVELAQDMTDEWFTENLKMLVGAFEKVRKALGYEARQLH